MHTVESGVYRGRAFVLCGSKFTSALRPLKHVGGVLLADMEREVDDEMSQADAAEAAVRQAAAEGLTLQPSDNSAGYRGVHVDRSNKAKPFQASLRRASKNVHLGCFAIELRASCLSPG